MEEHLKLLQSIIDSYDVMRMKMTNTFKSQRTFMSDEAVTLYLHKVTTAQNIVLDLQGAKAGIIQMQQLLNAR